MLDREARRLGTRLHVNEIDFSNLDMIKDKMMKYNKMLNSLSKTTNLKSHLELGPYLQLQSSSLFVRNS